VGNRPIAYCTVLLFRFISHSPGGATLDALNLEHKFSYLLTYLLAIIIQHESMYTLLRFCSRVSYQSGIAIFHLTLR